MRRFWCHCYSHLGPGRDAYERVQVDAPDADTAAEAAKAACQRKHSVLDMHGNPAVWLVKGIEGGQPSPKEEAPVVPQEFTPTPPAPVTHAETVVLPEQPELPLSKSASRKIKQPSRPIEGEDKA